MYSTVMYTVCVHNTTCTVYTGSGYTVLLPALVLVLFHRLRNEKFYNVDATELGPYTIIVTTTITARMLWLNGVDKGHFTHILIDEAAQVC